MRVRWIADARTVAGRARSPGVIYDDLSDAETASLLAQGKVDPVDEPVAPAAATDTPAPTSERRGRPAPRGGGCCNI